MYLYLYFSIQKQNINEKEREKNEKHQPFHSIYACIISCEVVLCLTDDRKETICQILYGNIATMAKLKVEPIDSFLNRFPEMKSDIIK